MKKENNGLFGDNKSSLSIKELLLAYLRQWPVFIIIIGVFLIAAFLFIKYAIPKYAATTSFLIIGKESGNPNTFDLIENALNVKKDVNVNNEMLLIGAQDLMQRTVAKNNFNISYFRTGHFQNIDIYTDAPFIFSITQIADNNKSYLFYIENLTALGGTILYDLKDEKVHNFRWNEPVIIAGNRIILNPKLNSPFNTGSYKIQWQPVVDAAAAFSKELIIKSYDSKTSVVQLIIKTDNSKKSKDVLNAVFAEFNRSDIEDRNNFSDSTVQFIDNRLLAISNDLNGVEGNLESYQGSRSLVDIKGQSNQSLENLNTVSKSIKDVAVQQDVTAMIVQYFNNPKNDLKLVPSSLGLADATLESLITQYNTLQLKRERDAPSVAANSTVMVDLNTQITSLKGSIVESLNNINSNLQLQQQKLSRQNNQYKSFLAGVPHNERVLLEIKRRQSITEGLYLYLLQKREEAAISTTSSKIAHYKQIDSATSYGQPEPVSSNIILYTVLLGLSTAFGFIFLRKILQDKIAAVNDITKHSSIQIAGKINHITNIEPSAIAIAESSIYGEQFRTIRTNISASLSNLNKKVILITSADRDDGKSFIALNLAMVYAIPGKKVCLLEFNLRQPSIAGFLQKDASTGLTNYLSGSQNNIEVISTTVAGIAGLDLYLCGPLPANAGDLLISEKMTHLFAYLKAHYDYIIIDTPAISEISDAQILGAYSDVTLLIVRYKKTLIKQIDFINELADKKLYPNICIVLNDVKLTTGDEKNSKNGLGASIFN